MEDLTIAIDRLKNPQYYSQLQVHEAQKFCNEFVSFNH